jgi:glycogen debranching enzyme
MDDVIQVQDQYYILATASRAVERTAVLQHGDSFAVFDLYGDVGALGSGEQGLYHEGTRYLSRFSLRLNGRRPLLLSARVKDENELFAADLTNPDLPTSIEGAVLARDLVHLFRSRYLWQGTWHERLRLCNFGRSPVSITLTFDIEADFADIFEVRGTNRSRRGTFLTPEWTDRTLSLSYLGLDGEKRWTLLEWSEPATFVSSNSVRIERELTSQEPLTLSLAIRCERAKRPVAIQTYDAASAELRAATEEAEGRYTRVESSSERFNQWVRRSAADVRMLTAKTAYGEYPYAGVPWFSAPFGRDGIITALQLLWVNPQLARGVLAFLAATQADQLNAEQDAEPGKILHEMRASEMARLGEVPFGRYYGSVDATPLFVLLAGAYFERTGDRAFITKLWPHVDLALEWIDRYGDRDGDGFVEYARRSAAGLVHQGWKDSQDSVFHRDGTLAEAPIALAEVQAYVYDAKLKAAAIADALGDEGRATRLRHQAEQLRVAFESKFWWEERSTYALALDGAKEPCLVRASNAGLCLFGGIASPERARRVADGLVSGGMWSGWGIRTVASGEARYNPMSYHNGSVWPHDTGLIAAGFSRYGFDDLVQRPFAALFDASVAMDSHRLPELFCGFRRRPGEGPTLYPVACSPQAWASGVVFQLIQASLRLSVDADHHVLTIDRATLPPFLSFLKLADVELPFGRIDLHFEQHTLDVAVTVLRKQGDFEVRVVK